MTRRTNNPRIAAVLLLAVLAGCGSRPTETTLGGSGTETVGVYGVAGSVTDSAGLPAAGALVKLRRQDFLDTSGGLFGKGAVASFDTFTDDTGGFFLPGIDTGGFTVEIATGGNSGAVLNGWLDRSDSLARFSRVRLGTRGSIRGALPVAPGTAPGTFGVFIYGMEHAGVVGVDGSFRIDGIPLGTYRIHIAGKKPIYASYELRTVNVAWGAATDLGLLQIPYNQCRSIVCDTEAVRAILDSNGLLRLSAMNVCRFEAGSGRLAVLDLAYTRIRILTAEIGRLRTLRVLIADGDSLRSLPREIGCLTSLRYLSLRRNRLRSLPAEMSELDSLEKLAVAENQLDSLPALIGRLSRLVELDASGNRIGSLPGGIGRCAELRALLLDGNLLSAVPDEIGSCLNLQALDLAGNRLTTLPATVGALTQMTHLDLQYNEIDSLPLTIVNLTRPNLAVHIAGNRLCERVPPEIQAWIDRYSNGAGWRRMQRCN